jgi:hypothetical protein
MQRHGAARGLAGTGRQALVRGVVYAIATFGNEESVGGRAPMQRRPSFFLWRRLVGRDTNEKGESCPNCGT